jgi:NitT/TauT family transport system substrate-binding protein
MKRSTFTGLAAAAVIAPRVAVAQTLTTIRVGTTAVESYALTFYAQDHGFFKAVGLDAQINIFNGGGAVLAAIAGGSLDLACANWGAISNAHVQGLPFQVIAPGGLYSSDSPTTILAVAKESTLKTAADLNGKTVAVSTLKDLQQASVMKWVDANGGDSKTLKFIELPIPQIPSTLNAGRVDAGIVLEPVLTHEKNNIRIFAKCYDAIAKRLMINAHFAAADWLTKNTPVARKIISALDQTATWANANRAAAGAILEQVSKIDVATISEMNRTVFTDRLDVATIQPVIDASVEYKFLAHGYPARDVFWPGLGTK